MNCEEYYFKPKKIIRDLIHGYINLTAFDLEIIDTIYFQRLSDIRQLTCQHVYPNARHTRFEHSLGVLELMRQAIKHINKNQFLVSANPIENELIDKNLYFNASLAALLHDIGHCPFSHLGETQFDKEETRKQLKRSIELYTDIDIQSSLYTKINKENATDIGSCHEIISCITILEKYRKILEKVNEDSKGLILCDFELIIRSILGIEYDENDIELSIQKNIESSKEDIIKKVKLNNLIINLLNSKIFDMDKLDYIMRDSFYTGIGTPKIDTKRIFRNIYLNNDFSIVFTSKAVPALQNMIDARDGLYMYVYNHHTVVFSDFLNSYIVRKLSQNTFYYFRLIYPDVFKNILDSSDEQKEYYEQVFKMFLEFFQISNIGLVPVESIFSISSIIDKNISDSDWISLINIINSYNYNCKNFSKDEKIKILAKEIRGEIDSFGNNYPEIKEYYKNEEIADEDVELLAKRLESTLSLINNYKSRNYLRPWWKTIFEFSIFMQQYFPDDNLREKICERICGNNKTSSELRAQIAQGVKYIVNKLFEEKINDKFNLQYKFEDGDFFIVQRPNGFLDVNKIEKLLIYLNANEIIGFIGDSNGNDTDNKYYGKKLNRIIPQKDYYELMIKDSFYIFSKYFDKNNVSQYESLKRIFAFVCAKLVNLENIDFNELFIISDICELDEFKKKNNKINEFRNKVYEEFKQVNKIKI